jgi:GLPGLI family protein
MKIYTKLSFIILIIAFANKSFAQKKISEGTITYDISIKSAKSDKSLPNGLNGAALNIYLKPTQSRSEMTSSLGKETDVFDNKAGKGFILKEYSGQKLMITLTNQNWSQKNQWNENLKFMVSNEIETIAGYQCKKAIGTSEDGRTVTVYFAPDIVIVNDKYNGSFSQLPGLPIKYELTSGDLIFTYTLKTVNYDPVASALFAEPKTGFRIMTYNENQQLKKGE